MTVKKDGMIVTAIAGVSTVSLAATRKQDCASVTSMVARPALLATHLSVPSVIRQRISYLASMTKRYAAAMDVGVDLEA